MKRSQKSGDRSQHPRSAASRRQMKFDENMCIAGYLSRSHPVQWVGWWARLTGTPDAGRLFHILFPDGESLADLTDENKRLEIFDGVIKNSHLRAAVLLEIRKAIKELRPSGPMPNELKRHFRELGEKWIKTVNKAVAGRGRARLGQQISCR